MRELGVEYSAGKRDALLAHRREACWGRLPDDPCPRHHSAEHRARRRREDGEHERRPATATGFKPQPHDLAHEVQLLTSSATRLMAAADERSRPRLDGRQVLADIRKERRKLITKALRFGSNSL